MRLRLVFALTALASVASARAAGAGHGPAEPVPIPGGFDVGGTFVHVLAPGPTSIGLQGENVDPSTITDFNGFSAIAYPSGLVTDVDGKSYEMGNDIRVFRGQYLAADGSHHHGTFGFV